MSAYVVMIRERTLDQEAVKHRHKGAEYRVLIVEGGTNNLSNFCVAQRV
ncbi:hypothetical protein M301_0045 [Methylotenera versatilis 301]|uniref:Uncharacterized protein n=1 Tax=Methylotenera versatilis (strain 301) TaxID=666681 RepID=D7DK48_METV0|nr:hypothetical protein M301_0045 [Methylotenera versatilis 301]